jgi:hypothetical protein
LDRNLAAEVQPRARAATREARADEHRRRKKASDLHHDDNRRMLERFPLGAPGSSISRWGRR